MLETDLDTNRVRASPYTRDSPYIRNENVVEYNLGSYTKNEGSNVASLNVVRATNIPNVVSLDVATFNQFISLLLTNMRKEVVVVDSVDEAPDTILVEDSIILLNEEDKMAVPNNLF
jgi:hypothetical protein